MKKERKSELERGIEPTAAVPSHPDVLHAQVLVAREHFKRNAQGTTGFHSEENGQPEFEKPQRVKLKVEEIEKLEDPLSSSEVVRALKRMKRGKGVGIDKVSSEMLLGGAKCCGKIWQLF